MGRLRVSIDSDLPPDRVLAAAEELSNRRGGLWRVLSRRLLELYEATGSYDEIGMRVTKRDGGSHIEIFSDRRPNGVPGLVIGTIVQLAGRRLVLESLRRALERAAPPARAQPDEPPAADVQRSYRPPAVLDDSVWCHVPSTGELGELLINALRPESQPPRDGRRPSSRRAR
jgi:hypothetical protein